ncbi:spore coat U domain-containing protein [Ralstonia pseudosolanacearum]|uniref:Spore coat U domain-containing protein n=1 Tax=Ralstonia pseudosolanacearum TaxID=1310165 RepID=A0A454TLN6_9RALS|nr:spore coat U domain-containing protein [Ralstonia pseudosolanacearum]RNM03021.1 spore coat U domain-containing protein [Ralstonia pseudosolanacearum]
MKLRSRAFSAALAAAACTFTASVANAGSSTATINIVLTVTAACTISANPLSFGSTGLITSPINQQGALNVTCTNQTPYQVGLDAGSAAGSTTSNRLLSNGTAMVPFALYSDAAHSSNWGNAQGTDTLAGTGNGQSQSIPVYGVVPAMATAPTPGSYSTSIVATVFF